MREEIMKLYYKTIKSQDLRFYTIFNRFTATSLIAHSLYTGQFYWKILLTALLKETSPNSNFTLARNTVTSQNKLHKALQ